ncbi:hypothetical protein G6L90_14470 [Agrobacterium tumefaciens]|uniref:hypothetical protein n=1 Tax=Agrobacterium tumefaciens TaxID=358 RepID=UPI0015718E34|nr:hypothetical protein [Agrobacterium tumefaciens]WHO21370.1 hypothetical protein G6L90_14470 [Agrobacterium tumefaciens]
MAANIARHPVPFSTIVTTSQQHRLIFEERLSVCDTRKDISVKRKTPPSPARLEVRPSVPDDVTYLAPRLRKADLESLVACASPSAEVSLTRGLRHSDICLTALDDKGRPAVMFGTVPYPQDSTVGNVWFLMADDLNIETERLSATASHYAETFHGKYPILSSFMDCRDRSRKRILKRCGFGFGKIAKSPGGWNFQEAFKIRSTACVIQ